MRSASVAFNVPEEMPISDEQSLRLLLSLAESIDDLKKALQARVSGGVEGTTIKVSPTMEAHLTGSAFQITSVTPEVQAISAATTTEWQWQVSATKGGIQSLHLTLDARVSIDGNNVEYVIHRVDKVIKVRVSWLSVVLQFISDHLEWLWSLLVPAALFLWHKLRSRKRRNASNAENATIKSP